MQIFIHLYQMETTLPINWAESRLQWSGVRLGEAVSEAFENFQLKTYGMKAQVHSTPDSKKQCRR